MNKGILYFIAHWCEPCKLFGPIVDSAATQKGIPVKKINIDYDTSFVAQYNVKSVPTIVLTDNNGNELNRLVGKHDMNTVINFIG